MMMMPLMNKLFARIIFLRGIARQRRQLKLMDDYLLKDIGISRADAEREASRPFWDYAPDREASPWRRGRGDAGLDLEESKLSPQS
jgi:uncharacterized protein YjiS (DUF1127 family)